MRNIFHRLLPVTSLLCLPLLGSYTPVTPWEGFSPDEAQLAELKRNAVYQTGAVTRDYQFTLIGDAPREGIVRDIPPFDDYRFFTMLTNFKCGTLTGLSVAAKCSEINSNILPYNADGQRFLDKIGPGTGAYGQSHNYPGYGRFHFNATKPKFRIFFDGYGGGLILPGTPAEYLQLVQGLVFVRATGVPHPDRKADPAAW